MAHTILSEQPALSAAHRAAPPPGSVIDGKRSPIATVLRGALALLMTQPITWAASLLATAFVPRYLTDSEMGQFAVALTVAGLAGTVVALGIPTSLVRAVASRPWDAKREGAAALVLVLGLSAVTAVGVSVVWSWLALPGSESGILPYALLGMVISNGLQVGFAVLIGLEQHARFAWVNAAASALSQLASVGALVLGGSLLEFVAVGVAVQLVVALVAWRLARLDLAWDGISRARMGRIATEGLPFLGSLLMGRLRGDIEITMLAFLLSEQAVGWWAAASRIVSAPIFIPVLIATPLLPALSQSAKDRPQFDRTLRRSLVMVVLVTVPLGAMVGALAPAIPGRLGWAASFDGTIPLLMMLSASMPLIAIGIVLGTAMMALGQERQLLGVNIAATLVTASGIPLVLSLLAPWTDNGSIGAGVVRIATETVMVAGAAICLPRGIVDWATLGILGRIVLAASGMVAVTLALLPLSPELAGLAGGGVFVVGVLLLRVVQPHEILALRAAALGMLRRRGRTGG